MANSWLGLAVHEVSLPAGCVPVVLIHGTASSPARWADPVNEVQNDPVLRERVQMWVFLYNTSNPILHSASELRRSLETIVTVIGEGRPLGLDHVVVTYESAHIDGVASEKIVRSSHSTQGHPERVLEIERILREHVGYR